MLVFYGRKERQNFDALFFPKVSLSKRSYLNHRMGLGWQCSWISNVTQSTILPVIWQHKETRCNYCNTNQFLSHELHSLLLIFFKLRNFCLTCELYQWKLKIECIFISYCKLQSVTDKFDFHNLRAKLSILTQILEIFYNQLYSTFFKRRVNYFVTGTIEEAPFDRF